VACSQGVKPVASETHKYGRRKKCFALIAKEYLAATDEDELLAEWRELCGEK
jgi:hypothetical protein